VLGTHVLLSDINDFLKEIVEDKNGYAVIVEKNTDELIANSFDMSNFITQKDGNPIRLKLSEIQNGTILQAYEEYKSTKEAHNVFGNGKDNRTGGN
jgi:glycosyltransferase involved in cell wall biosynthesis